MHHAEQTVEKINDVIVLFGKINERRWRPLYWPAPWHEHRPFFENFCASGKINWEDWGMTNLLRMSVNCNEVKWCVDTTPLRSLPKSTPVIMLLFRRFSWLKTWYQFYFRRLSLWSIVVQLACPLTHSSGVFFNWQSTLCSGLNTRSLEIRHSVYFLFLFSLALICCSQGPLLVCGNRGSAGHEQLF